MNITDPRPSRANIHALQQIDLGERVKPAGHPRDDHDLAHLNRLRERTDQLLRTSQDDAAQRPIVSSPLALEIPMQPALKTETRP